ncbi:chromosome partitioning protein [Mesorhizobium sp. M2D.F.Ca.ET.185.01.1.1]|uniref:CpsD/CapB family tyrosine-protein kinase n=1 Tax=unclassified Mesorhizobium TaxID=325217 RepID=UPI000FCB04B1|nr:MULTISPECIES: CpsD/CapB family tyrosine-protein kinase [unclassified Mesorhizobium]TGP80987.1 chromosome partitioning protein [bacterium M00.F.Ca.ET.227.01.1.1]TGP90770.1 chromosome partitioning protein [bacterium M00.F.Ca.ET.221.01.1.1]TGP97449.1 chromosome partitioning protein [bacterium M00.F.Ca.ET.222.01.1.1]TGT75980.1 chromosome partitioning protein [bacterium M00.F.Ca.ET.159.01.1.1]TGT85041.1 chromosome partitioning protein [bacterium M00.F.Ca.ET.157.01.1.1]TGU07950.1 chromosome part
MPAKVKLQPAAHASLEVVAQQSIVSVEDQWAGLELVELDGDRAREARLVTFAPEEPAQASFDVLRTKVVRCLNVNNWTTVAITSPEPESGKSVVAANLAFSLANLQSCRVVLLDLNLRQPQISSILGLGMARPTESFLQGRSSIKSTFVRYGDNLAVSAGSHGITHSAELLQSQSARTAMIQLHDRLCPTVVIVDLPAVLGSDDVLAFLPNIDCTLLVAGAGTTTMAKIRCCEQEIAGETNLLGIVLNKCRYGRDGGYY